MLHLEKRQALIFMSMFAPKCQLHTTRAYIALLIYLVCTSYKEGIVVDHLSLARGHWFVVTSND
jgi:hypothetical protein